MEPPVEAQTQSTAGSEEVPPGNSGAVMAVAAIVADAASLVLVAWAWLARTSHTKCGSTVFVWFGTGSDRLASMAIALGVVGAAAGIASLFLREPRRRMSVLAIVAGVAFSLLSTVAIAHYNQFQLMHIHILC